LPLWRAKSGAVLGLGGVGTSSLLSRSRTLWLLVVYTCETVRVQGKQFESEDCNNIAVTASLHHLSKDECRAGVDCLPHRWEKCVDSAGDYIE
jgi:hypothetical protein